MGKTVLSDVTSIVRNSRPENYGGGFGTKLGNGSYLTGNRSYLKVRGSYLEVRPISLKVRSISEFCPKSPSIENHLKDFAAIFLSTNFDAKTGLPASGDSNVSCCAWPLFMLFSLVFLNQV